MLNVYITRTPIQVENLGWIIVFDMSMIVRLKSSKQSRHLHLSVVVATLCTYEKDRGRWFTPDLPKPDDHNIIALPP